MGVHECWQKKKKDVQSLLVVCELILILTEHLLSIKLSVVFCMITLQTLTVLLCSTVQSMLSEGGIPQRPVVFVSRPELVNRAREKLYRLQKEPGWITVFGMAGSGKSVLAAEAVRDHGIIEGEYLTDIKH